MVEPSVKQPAHKQVGSYCFDPTAQPLGAGAFGVVYKGYLATDEKVEVAIKVISKAILDQYREHIELFLREIEILKMIKGKHVLEFKEVLRTSNNIYIITTFCNGGSLEGKLKENQKKSTEAKASVSEDEALRILKQIADAFIEVKQLELKKDGKKVTIMHRDIKPANILFHNGEVCIADFGFAKLVDDATKDKEQIHTILGTPWYMPPQILKEAEYSAKCDVWSTGIVFYQILHGYVPYNTASRFMLEKKIRTDPLKFGSGLKDETKDLITKMLAYEEADRINWEEILAHPAIPKDVVQEKPKDVVQEKKKPKFVIVEESGGSTGK